MLLRDDILPPEAYVLTVTAEGIRVQVACEQSVILALTTLYQLMDGQRRVPCLSLTDAPRYQHRGLSLDCVRCFFPVGEVRRVIEQMARVKLNVLHWVLTNDQGWRIESRQYPRLNEISGPYYTRDADSIRSRMSARSWITPRSATWRSSRRSTCPVT